MVETGMNGMFKNTLIFLAISSLSTLAFSAPADIADSYFTNPNPKLTNQERSALAIAQRWQSGGVNEIRPVSGSDGFVKFPFGSQQTSIVCAVLQICDVELQAGEQVNSINLGDKERWVIEPAVTGSAAGDVMHLIIKPLDVGLDTSLVVTTNRRTYHLRLRSHRTEYMPRVGFIYSEDGLAKWNAFKTREAKAKQIQTIPETGEQLSNLNFGYSVTGNAKWKPVRVYNDGRKTVIQLPASAAQGEAPALLVLKKEGGFFSEDETVMVNYRVHGDRYIVDSIFDKAILIAGVGSNQDRVVITNTNEPATTNSMQLEATRPTPQQEEILAAEIPAPQPTPVIQPVEQYTTIKTVSSPLESPRWEILDQDMTLQKTLARWARVAQWDVQFKDVPEMRNPGYFKVNARDFLSAADWVLGQAKAAAFEANIDLSVTAFSNKVLVITAKDIQK